MQAPIFHVKIQLLLALLGSSFVNDKGEIFSLNVLYQQSMVINVVQFRMQVNNCISWMPMESFHAKWDSGPRVTISKNSKNFTTYGDIYIIKNCKKFKQNLKKWRRKKLFSRGGVVAIWRSKIHE